jgi:plasmid maintenance system antidote protein VapI
MLEAGSLDAVHRIPARLEALGMSRNMFAELVGVSRSEFSRLMNQETPLSGKQTVEFYRTLDALERLVRAFHPVPIRWNNVEQIRDLLETAAVYENDADLVRGVLSSLGETNG